MAPLLALLLFAIACFLVWWLVFETEGVYLGKRAVIALYDLYAHRYDRIKQFDETADLTLIGQPLLERISPLRDPLILDVATGAGRLPLIAARLARFEGHVIGIDASRQMLAKAQEKIIAGHFEAFITLMQHDASALPFNDSRFDVVTCIEALEFMPRPKQALAEMVRVLRPGGLLLTTIRIDTRWMPDRTWSEERMRAELKHLDMRDIDVMIWQEDYSQVWAWKTGGAPAIGRAQLESALGSTHQIPITYDVSV